MSITIDSPTPRYLQEFPGFGDIGIELGDGWEDVSASPEELCPTFVHRALGLYLYVDYEDYRRRVEPGAFRYYLCEIFDEMDPIPNATKRVDQNFWVDQDRELIFTNHADVVLGYVQARQDPRVRYAHRGYPFHLGQRVQVQNSRYQGAGVVVAPHDYPSHIIYQPARGFLVAVEIPNGNTWFYEVDTVRAISE